MGDRERDNKSGQSSPGGSGGQGQPKGEPDDRSESGRGKSAQSGRGNTEQPPNEQGQFTEEGPESNTGGKSRSDDSDPDDE